jgi:hypothetical protein
MADATIRDHAHARPPAAPAAKPRIMRPSLLALPAGGRLLGASIVIAALWAGVYWALR